ncbi:MAG: hypothetical protein ACJ735_09715 [Actinomycetes bacterium]
MEDRQPLGLWLELLRGDDVEARAAVLADAGLRVSTWIADDYPERLPKTIDDCASLLVGEGDPATYDALPAAAETTTVVPLRRFPRPSQGICTGERTTGLLLVLISPRAEADAQALRDWADFVHLRWIAAACVPGYTMITPYAHVDAGTPRFCHFYEMTSDDPRKTFESMTPLVCDLLGGPQNPAFVEWTRHPALRINYCNSFRRLS